MITEFVFKCKMKKKLLTHSLVSLRLMTFMRCCRVSASRLKNGSINDVQSFINWLCNHLRRKNLSTDSRARPQTRSVRPTVFTFNQVIRVTHSLPDLWPGWRQDRQQVEWGHAEGRTGVGDRSGLPGASDRCECLFSSSKLLRTEAENKHLGFRDDIPRYQPLANSSTYIRGQDTAVFRLWCRLAVGAAQRTRGETREVNMRSRPSENSSALRMAT